MIALSSCTAESTPDYVSKTFIFMLFALKICTSNQKKILVKMGLNGEQQKINSWCSKKLGNWFPLFVFAALHALRSDSTLKRHFVAYSSFFPTTSWVAARSRDPR